MIPPSLAVALLPVIVLLLLLRYKPGTAIAVSVIGGYLFLPERTGIDLPLLPAFNKHTIPVVVAAIYLFFRYYNAHTPGVKSSVDTTDVLPGWLPSSKLGLFLLALVLLGPFFTVLTNGDPLRLPSRTIPGLRPYDAIALIATTGTTMLLPLLLARKFLATEQGHRTLLLAVAIIGIAYSFLAAYEIRMSPQLHLQVYGFRASNWRQTLRGDGFRPSVFLHHGLWLGIFMSCATLACFAAFRSNIRNSKGALFLLAGLWMFVVLFLSKAFGAFLIAAALVPVMIFLPARLQMVTASVLAIVILVYPGLRGANIIPTEAITNQVLNIDYERAASLRYRFNNEDILLAKANERPLFGWGGWARSRVYNENGRDISTTDGRWVIIAGEEGWFGYIGKFGLMALPILILTFRKQKYNVTAPTAGLSIVLVANMIDLIPNGTLTIVTWLIAGALLGRLDARNTVSEADDAPALPVQSPAGTRMPEGHLTYTRFPRNQSRT